MEQFSLDKWLESPNRKVVTRSGHNVRILCTDQRGSMPIVAIVEFGTLDGVQIFYSDGKNENHREYDLFFADEEEKPQSIEIPFGAKDSEFVRDEYYIPEGCEARIEGNKVIIEKIQEEEMTEFEKAVKSICKNLRDGIDDISDIHVLSSNLLNLARKKLEKEYRLCDKADSNWEAGWNSCYEDLIQNLPKLVKNKYDIDPTIPVMYTDAASKKSYVEYDGYEACINDLFEKLPKEE